MIQDDIDALGRKLFGETLQDASIRVLAFMAALAFVLGTLAWLLGG
jgi:hypothetical protein